MAVSKKSMISVVDDMYFTRNENDINTTTKRKQISTNMFFLIFFNKIISHVTRTKGTTNNRGKPENTGSISGILNLSENKIKIMNNIHRKSDGFFLIKFFIKYDCSEH